MGGVLSGGTSGDETTGVPGALGTRLGNDRAARNLQCCAQFAVHLTIIIPAESLYNKLFKLSTALILLFC